MIDERLNGVRAELALRVAALDARGGRATQLAGEVDALRRLAHENGMYPAVTVAHALESALARGECGAMIRGWLDILRDAVGCERSDPATCATYAAACSVRYG